MSDSYDPLREEADAFVYSLSEKRVRLLLAAIIAGGLYTDPMRFRFIMAAGKIPTIDDPEPVQDDIRRL